MDIFSVLSQRLKEQRKAAGLTQEEAAEAAGVVQTYVSNLENGHNNPGVVELLYKLAQQYDTSIDYLFGRADDSRLHKQAPRSAAAQRVMSLLNSLPEHRREDVAELTLALIQQEKRRFAFWLVVLCAECGQPMTGYFNDAGTIFYRCESDNCHTHTVNEEALASLVLETTITLVGDGKIDYSDDNTGDFFASLRKLGRRFGFLSARQELHAQDAIEIVRALLANQDRSIPQAWLEETVRIYAKNGEASVVKVL